MEKNNFKDLYEFMVWLILKTFFRLQWIYDHQCEGFEGNKNSEPITSRLVFPLFGAHRNYQNRVSEQELRFVFVETFNDFCCRYGRKLFYSVETPTFDKYSGYAKGKPKCDEMGRSAEFDLVIYDENYKRVCLIEFKANTPPKSEYDKDYKKLNNPKEGDENCLRFFVEILKNYDKGTMHSIKEKNKGKEGTIFMCYSLEKQVVISSVKDEYEEISISECLMR